MSNTLMNLGVSGLNAALWGLTTTSNNISNAATPGYSVQRPVYAEASSQYSGSGYMPQGVNTVTVQRQYSQYLSDQLNTAQTQGGALSTWYTLVAQLNNYIGSPTAGSRPGSRTTSPGCRTSRTTHPTRRCGRPRSATQTLANQLNAAGQQYDALRQSVNTQLTSTVSQINTYTAQIAQLNQQIAAASSQAAAEPAAGPARPRGVEPVGLMVSRSCATTAVTACSCRVANRSSSPTRATSSRPSRRRRIRAN